MKKKFCSSYSFPVYKSGYRSFIEFWATDSNGEKKRFRPTFDLNRIHNMPDRHERGRDLCKKLRFWLEQGFYFEDFNELEVIHLIKKQEQKQAKAKNKTEKQLITVLDALEIGLRLKHNPEKTSTNNSYASHVRRFTIFLKKYGYSELSISNIDQEIIYEYLDYYKLNRGVRNNTINNIITHLKSIFYSLKSRGYLKENPFVGMKKYKQEEKIRRNFTEEEASLILRTVYEEDIMLFYSIILIYACLLRPCELRRLRFRDINLNKFVVSLDGKRTKSGHSRTAAIPTELQPYFEAGFWKEYPEHYFIFGNNVEPHPEKPCGKSSLYRRHEKLLKQLHKKGLLKSIQGLHYYSWKDTGITQIIDTIGLVVAYDQAGHKDIKDTMKYRHATRVNEKVRDWNFGAIVELKEPS